MRTKILSLILAFVFLYALLQSKEKVEQSEEFLLSAVEFHGHLGPYLVLGLRAGLHANQILGKNPMETEAFIKTKQLLLNRVLLMERSCQLDVHLERETFLLNRETACS